MSRKHESDSFINIDHTFLPSDVFNLILGKAILNTYIEGEFPPENFFLALTFFIAVDIADDCNCSSVNH